MEREKAQAEVDSGTHSLNNTCWDKCVQSTPSTKFARGEETCLFNCVDRFFDASSFLIGKVSPPNLKPSVLIPGLKIQEKRDQ